MRILITGGAGFLGAHLVSYCLQKPGAEITVLDSLEFLPGTLPENLKAFWDRITYIRGSVCNNKLLKEIIPYQDIIFHCAAQTSHLISIRDPAGDAEVNAEGTLKLLETMRLFHRDAVLIYPSTTSVIGKPQEEVVDESHPLNPRDIYSIHKALSEHYCLFYAKFHGIKMAILRFGNLYGPYGKVQPEYGFINYFIDQALKNERLTIFGSGNQNRNVMYAQDAADLMYRAAFNSSVYGTFWFATGSHYLSVLEIARQITEIFQSGLIVHAPWPEDRKQIEVGSVKVSSAALSAKLGSTGSVNFQQGLQKILQLVNPSHLSA